MDYNKEKIDKAALALLYLGYDPQTQRCWKSFDWDITDRLFEAGYISDPKTKNKTVVLTDEGKLLAEKVLEEDFSYKVNCELEDK